MRYIIKDLKETIAGEALRELHLVGCSHLKINMAQTSGVIEAESAESAIKIDMTEEYDKREDWKIAPCAKGQKNDRNK